MIQNSSRIVQALEPNLVGTAGPNFSPTAKDMTTDQVKEGHGITCTHIFLKLDSHQDLMESFQSKATGQQQPPEQENMEIVGKINCPHCNYKLGSFNLTGMQCSCSEWVFTC